MSLRAAPFRTSRGRYFGACDSRGFGSHPSALRSLVVMVVSRVGRVACGTCRFDVHRDGVEMSDLMQELMLDVVSDLMCVDDIEGRVDADGEVGL